jgi:hypothetical protein
MENEQSETTTIMSFFGNFLIIRLDLHKRGCAGEISKCRARRFFVFHLFSVIS